METTATSVPELLILALILGAAGDVLFQDAGWGINVVLELTLLLVSVVTLRRRTGTHSPGRALWAIGPALLAASGFALRDSPTLAALAALVLVVCVLLGMYDTRTGWGAEPGILTACRAMLETGVGTLVSSLEFVRQDLPLVTRPSKNSAHKLAVGRGVLLALPLLLVFGGLLASADPVFAHYVTAPFQWDLSTFWVRCLWIILGSCLAAGYLRLLFRPEPTPVSQEEDAPARFSIGGVETAIVLGALNTLFFLFVLVQFRYFFGGRETVLSTVGMTYAAYARHGFFELVTVAGLTLPLLLIWHTLQERSGLLTQLLFRGLAGLLLILLFVIMASALARMNLYRREYGLTELRIYTTAFMGWLALVFVWFGATVLRGQRRHFVSGAFTAACFVIGWLFGWNPDVQIVRANTTLSQSGHPFDAAYAASLSADAVPALIAALPSLTPTDQQAVAARLLRRWPAPKTTDWRAWCWGRWTAQRCMARHQTRLVALSKLPSMTPTESADPQTETITQVVPAKPR